MIALALALQAAAVQPPPQRIDILAQACPDPVGEEVVVCGKAEAPRLPLPGERGPPDRPVPGNPDVSGAGALAMARAPCATLQGGCQTGVNMIAGGVAAVRLVGKLIDPNSCCDAPGEATSVGALASKVGRLFAKKPDKSNRVPIRLDDLPPPSGE